MLHYNTQTIEIVNIDFVPDFMILFEPPFEVSF